MQQASVPTRTDVLIGGALRAPAQGDSLPLIDPSVGEESAPIPPGTARDIDAAVKAARAAREGAWARLAPLERGRLLMRLARAVEENHERLAKAEAVDTGKPMKQAKADITALARYFEFYGGAC